ncbi:MAG TPA: hypothetical protein VF618_01510 [Thermoanaerobaculia bacterium]
MSTSDYFLEIEARFAERRGTPFILSAKDWVLMKKWQEDGVPLPVVIEAIDTVFERNETSGRKKTISSLSYCKHAVKELWEERKSLAVGGDSAEPEEGAEALVMALAADLDGVGLPAASAMAAQVRELARERSVPKIEERLIELEHELIESVIATAPDVATIRAEVVRALGDTSRLDEATRKRTEEANLRRVVRERFGLPRMTLFR